MAESPSSATGSEKATPAPTPPISCARLRWKAACGCVLRLDRPEPLEIDLERTPRAEAIVRVVRARLSHHIDVNDERGFRAHLEDRAGVGVDDAALWREYRETVAKLEARHRNLTALTFEPERWETFKLQLRAVHLAQIVLGYGGVAD